MSPVLLVVAIALIAGWLLAVAVIDQRTGRIPNRLVLPAVAGTAVVALLVPAVGLSACVLAVPYLAAFACGTVGGGDVKLAVPCGGLLADPVTAVLAALLAAVGTLLVSLATKRSRHPHGPALTITTVLLMMLK
ncbi:A24 family peptidase [Gordonia phthalatica]|uniref:Prepilin type IV endopeptidase peptidase domain-containing protein n=1 Tax=Gordonia phthalatica TaxID=1136941 RepID=A0A0N9NB58_9ACTN|nr:A24 family peptidase [Gordonia phthalatica]ALG84733.1 hypothetical protein ACH46_09785 [Gordonia phthalatica]